MGTFCTTTSLETYWVGSSFDGLTALASTCITDAEDEIRKRLSRRFDVSSDYFQTSTSTPPAIENICKWYALGLLFEATSRGGKDAYSRADRYLKKAESNITELLEYKAQLVDSSGDVVSDASDQMQVLSNTSTYSSTFNEDDELSWGVDSDKLDDIETERDS